MSSISVFESYAVMVTAMSAPIALSDQFDFGSNTQAKPVVREKPKV